MMMVKRCSFGGLVFGLWLTVSEERSGSVGLGFGEIELSGVNRQR